MTEDESWGADEVHYVMGDVVVPSDVTLTIEAGTVVKFAYADTELRVQGHLVTHGTGSAMIVFTCDEDDMYGGDTNGDGDASSPAAGYWRAVVFDDSTINTLHHVVIRFAGSGNAPAMWATDGTDLSVEMCQIEQSQDEALYIWDSNSRLAVSAAKVFAASRGVYVAGGAEVNVEGCTIQVSSTGIRVDAANTIFVSNNYIQGTGTGTSSAGLHALGDAVCTVSGNTIEAFYVGVQQNSSTPWTISNNLFRANTYAAAQYDEDLVFSENRFVGNHNQVVLVSGTLQSDMEWENLASNAAYLITGDLTVPTATRLLVDAGTVVKFDLGRHLIVQGLFDLYGTSSAPVVFTSAYDDAYAGDTNGDGTATAPAAGNWGYIDFGAGIYVLENVVIRYGGQSSVSDDTLIRVRAATDLRIQDSRLEHSGWDAIYVNHAAASVTIVDAELLDAQLGLEVDNVGLMACNGMTIHARDTAVRIDGGSDIAILACVLQGPGSAGYGVYVTGAAGCTFASNIVEGFEYGIYQASTTVWPATSNVILNNEYAIYQGDKDLLLAGNNIADNVHPAVLVTGALTTNTTWEDMAAQGGAYWVSGYLVVPAGVALTVKPNTAIKLQFASTNKRYVQVNGVLDLQGTHTQPVLFTSDRDDSVAGDTNGDGSATSPAPGDWLNIQYSAGGPHVLDHAVVRYAGSPAVSVAGPDVTVDGCVIEQASGFALQVNSASSDLTLTGSELHFGSSYGLYVSNAGVVNVSGTEIVGPGSTGTGILISSGTSVTVDGCTIEGCQTGVKTYSATPFALSNCLLQNNQTPLDQGVYDISLVGNTIVNNTYQRVALSGGSLAGNTVLENLTDQGVAYWWSAGTLTVPAGKTLAIAPGTVIKPPYDPNGTYSGVLDVSGTLDVQGTPAAPVIFTSVRDDTYAGDTNGDGSATSPAPGNWKYIQFSAGGPHVLDHAVVRYAGSPAVSVAGPDVTVDGCVIEQASGHALQVTSTSSDLTVADSALSNWSSYGLYVSAAGAVNVSGTEITGPGSTGTGILISSGTSVTVDGCTIEGCQTGVRTYSAAPFTLSNCVLQGNQTPIEQGLYDIALVGNTIANNTYQRVALGSGSLAGNTLLENLTDQGVAYWFVGTLNVPAGKTLTIAPGTVLKFIQNVGLTVNGMLDAQGSPALPIVFTSYRDDEHAGDTNADGASGGSRGDWYQIALGSGAVGMLYDVLVRYGGPSGVAMVSATGGASITVEDSMFEEASTSSALLNVDGTSTEATIRDTWFNNALRGIYASGTADVVALYNTFGLCPDAALRVSGSAVVDVHKCNLLTSNYYGVYNGGSVEVDAKYNYWGASDGPGPGGPGSGCRVSTNVDYYPWETELVPPGYSTPAITSMPNLVGEFGIPYQYDADGCVEATGTGTLVWSLRAGPTNFQIDSASGCVTWIPDNPGDFVIKIQVEDDLSLDVQTFQVHVVPGGGDPDAPRVAAFSYEVTGQGGGLWDAILTVTFTEHVEVSPIDVAILDGQQQVFPFDWLNYDVGLYRLRIGALGLLQNQGYMLVLADTITDAAGNHLDGEFDGHTFPSGNGQAGGDFLAGLVYVLRGDLNCSGSVSFDDINAFVLRLSNPAAYQATYPDCPDANGDINGNGMVGFDDINPFVALLTGG